MRRTIIIGVALTVAVSAGSGWASDGCVEISQVNVATAGTISTPGCYVLTSDLSQGLTINPVDGVTVDLNGFKVTVTGAPAITLNGSIDNVEIRNGTLDSNGLATVQASAFPGGVNHVYRALRIVNTDSIGIHYELEGVFKNLQVENVTIDAALQGVNIVGAEAAIPEVRHARFHRVEIAAGTQPGIDVHVGTDGGMFVYGFQVESSCISTVEGPAAIQVILSSISMSEEFDGSVRSSELVSGDAAGGAVVVFDALNGALYCSDNHVVATFSGANNQVAFWGLGIAPIVIRNNTSIISDATGPIKGSVQSPTIGHDGSTYLLSNHDRFHGAY